LLNRGKARNAKGNRAVALGDYNQAAAIAPDDPIIFFAFAYLRTLKPVHHNVDNTEPSTDCQLCGHKHGFGQRNKQPGPENP
jgi:hypothetical protein